jgi:uncharacterized protein
MARLVSAFLFQNEKNMEKTNSNLNQVSTSTIIGLIIAFFGVPITINLFQSTAPSPLTNSFVIAKELSAFLVTGILILIIIKGEKLGLNSIGIHSKHWGKSILWSLVILLSSFAAAAACLGIFSVVGISFGEGGESKKYITISLWVMSLMMLRAGVVEEICYRGYIMERLEKISGKWVVYFLLPSIIFGLLHFRQGLGGIIISFVLGMVLSYFYWKKRDLKANIIAHFLVDFIPNVVVPVMT